jgi:hypothetical protein
MVLFTIVVRSVSILPKKKALIVGTNSIMIAIDMATGLEAPYVHPITKATLIIASLGLKDNNILLVFPSASTSRTRATKITTEKRIPTMFFSYLYLSYQVFLIVPKK